MIVYMHMFIDRHMYHASIVTRRFVLSPGPTHASQCYVPERKATSPSSTSVAGGDTVTLHTPSSSSIDVMKQSNTDDQGRHIRICMRIQS